MALCGHKIVITLFLYLAIVMLVFIVNPHILQKAVARVICKRNIIAASVVVTRVLRILFVVASDNGRQDLQRSSVCRWRMAGGRSSCECVLVFFGFCRTTRFAHEPCPDRGS